jgi:hypothetical protein
MVGHLLGVALIALGAAFCYACSNVIEQRQASAAPPETSLRIALLWHLARQPIWWLGIAVDLSGFALQVLALGVGTLVFVQPLLVTSLLFSLVLGALAGSHRLSRKDIGWALVFMAALSIFLIVAAPSGGVDERSLRAWALPFALVAGLVAISLLISQRVTGAYRAAALAAAAGMTFGVSSTLMKTFAHQVANDGLGLLAHWQPYALGLVVASGFLIMQSAFQAGDLRASLPTLEVAEPIVAGILGVTLMNERLHATDGRGKAVIAISVVSMVVSAVLLARSAADDRHEPPSRPSSATPANGVAGRPALPGHADGGGSLPSGAAGANWSSRIFASRRRSTLPESSQGSSDWSAKTATWRGTR